MNDGVKILLDRMVTHPEEFTDATNLGATKWSGLLNYYDNVLTLEEKKAIEQGLLKIKRNAFTQQVMERLLDEPSPVEIDPNTYTFNTVGRDPWGSSSIDLKEQVVAHQAKIFDDLYKDEIRKLMQQELNTQTKAEKNKSKMEQLLQNVTKKRQVY